MAVRKNNTKNTRRGSRKADKPSGRAASKRPVALLFWAFFFIVVASLFLLNRERIRETLENTRVLDRLPLSFPGTGGREEAGETGQAPEEPPQPAPPLPAAPPAAVQPASPPAASQPPAAEETDSRPAESAPPAVSVLNSGETEPRQPVAPPEPSSRPQAAPVETPPEPSPPAAAPPVSPAAAPPAAARQERGIYFVRIDAGGVILRTRVIRRLPASDSPLTDSLRSLIAGPSAEEERQGLRSLIPPETRLLSSIVRGNTAYISFSEDFQYNTFGVEGYAAQLRQIVWTATEFSNVKDVQILIEGRRIDYLGESIWIGSPLGRESPAL